MKAIVKNVMNKKFQGEEVWLFTESMMNFIGKVIKVKEIKKDWFLDTENDYAYHKSWLDFVE